MEKEEMPSTPTPIAKQTTESQNIPASKKILITDAKQLPANYSSTPGGTLYSTTPGGTRAVVYDRDFLMNLRNSPVSRTPPKGMNSIPATILKDKSLVADFAKTTKSPPPKDASLTEESSEQFEMEM